MPVAGRLALPTVALALLCLSTSTDAANVSLGYIAQRSFTGRASIGGLEEWLVMLHAVGYLNSIGPHNFELTVREASLGAVGSLEQRCSAAAQSLVDSGAHLVFGPGTSACANPSATVLSAAGVAQVAHSATAISLSNKTLFPTFFRTVPSDLGQAADLARVVDVCPSWTEINVIASDDTYGSQLAESFVTNLRAKNVTVVHDLRFPQGAPLDVISSRVDTLRDSGVSVTALLALHEDAKLLLTYADTVGMSASGYTWLVSDAVTSSSVPLDDALNEAFSGMVGVALQTQATPLFTAAFEFNDQTAQLAQYDADVSLREVPFTALLFDAALAVAHAMNVVGDSWPATLAEQRVKMLQALRQFNSLDNGYPAASAPTSYFDSNQDGAAPYAFVNLLDGQWEFAGYPRDGPDSTNFQFSTQAGECPPPRIVEGDTRRGGKHSSVNTATYAAAAVGGFAFFVLVALLLILIRYRSRSHEPYDFQHLLEELSVSGEPEFPREIPRACVQLEVLLGEGFYGEVHKATLDELKYGGVPAYQVAVKQCRPGGDATSLMREAGFMAQFHTHPNVVSLIGVVTVGEPKLVVLQYCEHGALDELLINRVAIGQHFPVSQKMSWAAQVAAGMEHIAGLGGVHRDLAARNVLVTSNMTCKVSDFGMSREGSIYIKAKNIQEVPVRWTSPEGLVQGLYSSASDVWSFGIVIWEVLTDGQVPYGELGNHAILTAIRDGEPILLHRPYGCPGELYELCQRCWEVEPRLRPTFTELKEKLLTLASGAVRRESRRRGMTVREVAVVLGGPEVIGENDDKETASSEYCFSQASSDGRSQGHNDPKLFEHMNNTRCSDDLETYIVPSIAGSHTRGVSSAAVFGSAPQVMEPTTSVV
eukprot:m.129570 g.129570  ORF g.129570 m.129570 type:complete len:877 (+) comp16763_c0_seq5:284-2914(+)